MKDTKPWEGKTATCYVLGKHISSVWVLSIDYMKVYRQTDENRWSIGMVTLCVDLFLFIYYTIITIYYYYFNDMC